MYLLRVPIQERMFFHVCVGPQDQQHNTVMPLEIYFQHSF